MVPTGAHTNHTNLHCALKPILSNTNGPPRQRSYTAALLVDENYESRRSQTRLSETVHQGKELKEADREGMKVSFKGREEGKVVNGRGEGKADEDDKDQDQDNDKDKDDKDEEEDDNGDDNEEDDNKEDNKDDNKDDNEHEEEGKG
ncbi:uncharacterized protein F5147DRAFT_659250 [Suillus discolor]|uniref:Uncharacterized protein n=1 Tax=Suillus discolor TaxID=1912936 RepID=A0A9P7ESV0_9AGAM|nr:uncharacterized protein F5147DRAFT_659250 [Suillus discolor]KAG2086219.1 hypothetical protein F5147DRAFT_659250 [Suillus discolor]